MLKLGMVSSFHPHSMCERVERVTTKTGRTSCTNWTISFGVSGFRQKLDALRVQTGQTLLEYQGFGRELICYMGTSMFFKLIWTSDFFCVRYAEFKVTSSISNMFWHLLLCKNWTHYVYKLDKLFRSIRVSDEHSTVTQALQCFLNLFELRTSFVFSMQHSKRRHQFPTCSDIICCFSVIYLIV